MPGSNARAHQVREHEKRMLEHNAPKTTIWRVNEVFSPSEARSIWRGASSRGMVTRKAGQGVTVLARKLVANLHARQLPAGRPFGGSRRGWPLPHENRPGRCSAIFQKNLNLIN
jgi:hypothetical protein